VNRGATIWDVIHSIPPAVTYDEVFLRAARRACYSLAKFGGESAGHKSRTERLDHGAARKDSHDAMN
jgi:hypothetical protein